MKTLLDYIRVLLLCVGGMLVSCTVLIVMSEQSNGTIAGKQSWIFFSLIWFALSVLFVVITKKGKIPFSFSLSDWLILAILAILIISYPWKLNPAPDKLTIILLLTAFWFLLRIVLISYPFLFSFFIFIYVFTGGVEALWGFAQVFHWIETEYMSEKLIGSFYSVAAYSGYLALILPLSLSVSCYYRSCKKLQWWRATTLLYYTASISSVLILIALILSNNRLAWMAAIISSVWVVWMRLGLSEKVKERWKLSQVSFMAISTLGILILILVAGSIGLIHNKVVQEKVPLWKISTSAAIQKPILGTGLGGFPNTLIRLNKDTSINGSVYRQEPLYVHNEYLQLLTEHGIIGLLLFLALLITSFYKGFKNKQWGACGALLSLSIYSLASYPLQIPSFLITLTFLLVICQVKYQDIIPPQEFYTYYAEPRVKGYDKVARINFIKNFSVIFFTVFLSSITYLLLIAYKNGYPHMEANYQKGKYLFERSEYIYPRFGHYPEFFCEYAQDLTQAHCYHTSTVLLEKAVRYSHHPAIYDILAQNLVATGNYSAAETYLLHTIQEHPGRLNSYYLLAKLYSSPYYYHPHKMKQMAKTVLNNNRIIYSRLNHLMEKEMRELLESNTKPASSNLNPIP